MSYDFRHGARASIWHEIAVRSHLVVAAVGTVALLGLAGTAIWLALPSQRSDVPASAGSPLVTQQEAEVQAASAAALKPVPAEPSPAAQNADELRAQTAGGDLKADLAVTAADLSPLPQADPRWTAPGSKSGRTAAKAPAESVVAEAASEGDGGDDSTEVMANAFADEDSGQADAAATAAIPLQKPPVDAEPQADADQQQAASADGRDGQTLRAVTMRSRPSSRGGVLGTVPGRTSVDVISCESWCEIVYNGKRGFVYKSFLRNDGR